MIIQIEQGIETAEKVAGIGESATVKGLMAIVIVGLLIVIWYNHKRYTKREKECFDKANTLQEERLVEVKGYAKSLQDIGNKFMEQTNKMLMVLELIKKNRDE